MSYSRKVKHLLTNPVNGPAKAEYNGFGTCEKISTCRTNPSRKVSNTVEFKVCVDRGKVFAARWKVFGDPVAYAAASWCVVMVKGKEIDELAHVITPERMALDLDINDELHIRSGCLAVIGAFIAALEDYRSKS